MPNEANHTRVKNGARKGGRKPARASSEPAIAPKGELDFAPAPVKEAVQNGDAAPLRVEEIVQNPAAVAEVSRGCLPLAEILGEQQSGFAPEQMAMLQRAYARGAFSHRAQKRRSGEPYFTHCVEVARKVATICPEPNAIAAALLHDTLEDTPYTFEEMTEEFPGPIADVVQGVTKLRHVTEHAGDAAGEAKAATAAHAETLRKMITAAGRDIRVIIVKLCDRWHNISTLGALSPNRRKAIAAETLEIYSPLAGILGLSKLRSDLEDMAMLHLYPEEYRDIAKQVAKRKSQREELAGQAKAKLERLLADNGIEGRVTGRSKHIFSIWRKMRAKNLGFDEVHDLIALRVIVNDVASCWRALSLVHEKFTYIQHSMDDHISQPKANGYQSLHTTVLGLGPGKVEVQIRTRDMHQVAEDGVAAHWKYKYKTRGKFEFSDFDGRLIDRLRQVSETLQNVDARDVEAAIKTDLFDDNVVVYTPLGQLRDLPAGSTPIDFAYKVHSQVGERCAGAKVDGRIVPLHYVLKNGETVEIITGRKAHPTRDWLDIAKTHHAKTRIAQWLKKQNYDGNVKAGRDSVVQALKSGNAPAIAERELDAQVEKVIVATSGRFHSVNALYAEIGFGAFKAGYVVDRLRQAQTKQTKKKLVSEFAKPESNILVEGQSGMVTNLAGCCSPTAGEPIIGFVRPRVGVVVHCTTCKTLERSLKKPGNRQRLVGCEWRDGTPTRKRTKLDVFARNRIGLLADVCQILREEGINIIKPHPMRQHADCVSLGFDVAISPNDTLPMVTKRLRSTESVIDVSLAT